jgi:hypothetical protein
VVSGLAEAHRLARNYVMGLGPQRGFAEARPVSAERGQAIALTDRGLEAYVTAVDGGGNGFGGNGCGGGGGGLVPPKRGGPSGLGMEGTAPGGVNPARPSESAATRGGVGDSSRPPCRKLNGPPFGPDGGGGVDGPAGGCVMRHRAGFRGTRAAPRGGCGVHEVPHAAHADLELFGCPGDGVGERFVYRPVPVYAVAGRCVCLHAVTVGCLRTSRTSTVRMITVGYSAGTL